MPENTSAHAKVIGSVAGATAVVPSGVPDDAAGVVVGDGATVAAELLALLAQHRVWERFTPSTV